MHVYNQSYLRDIRVGDLLRVMCWQSSVVDWRMGATHIR